LVTPAARSDADVALAVADGKADAGFAVETVARQFRLAFVPLFRERYDLVVWRRDYFEPPLQKLLEFGRNPDVRAARCGIRRLRDRRPGPSALQRPVSGRGRRPRARSAHQRHAPGTCNWSRVVDPE
jgi:hypothetical protein